MASSLSQNMYKAGHVEGVDFVTAKDPEVSSVVVLTRRML